ncbi:recombinase XerD [Rhodococcus erythropolis]|uniref:recombinase XerD n=1 Tax=Rhodococcus erythropolis TaxID=1833 RepID=UPI0033B9416C
MTPGLSTEGKPICRECAGIITALDCTNCGREAERLRGGHCARCVVTADLTATLRPHNPPDLRLKRLIAELANVSRPESIVTWMRGKAAAELLAKIGNRELMLSHGAFDALPPARHVEHLREMLVRLHILPDRGDPRLARFAAWLEDRLETLADRPDVRAALEQFARWHHLRRMRENRIRNMDNATRNAKQEITETGKFLIWLSDEHRATIDALTQAHVDEYFSTGTTTRMAARNFLQWRARTGIGKRYNLRYREARQTPLVSSHERLALIRNVLESDTGVLSNRIAALLFLLYALPVRRITELRTEQIEFTPTGINLHLGDHPAPVPEPLLPLFHEYLTSRANQCTTNNQSPWLFPGTRAGHHLTAQALLQTLRRVFGINILAVRNAVLHDLTKELDAATLADLLGYSNQVMNTHAARSGVPMGSYPASHPPTPVMDAHIHASDQ